MGGGDNAEQADFWTSGPGRYWVQHADELDVMHGGALDLLLAASAPQPGEAVLDIGCGAGASTLDFARRVAPGGRATGADISAPLLDVARQRLAAAGLLPADFVFADAQNHRFDPGAFDLVASRFGVMFFADPQAAFANLLRALRPGGRLVMACWSGPENNPWFTLPAKAAAAHIALPPAAPAEAPGPMAFRDADRVAGLLRAAGFADCGSQRQAFDLFHPGGVPALLNLSLHIGALPRLIRDTGAAPAQQKAILAGLATRLARYETADGARIPAEVHIFQARRP